MDISNFTVKYLEKSTEPGLISLIRENISKYKHAGFNPLFMGEYDFIEIFDKDKLIGGLTYKCKGNKGVVHDCVVIPSYQNKGVGSYLMSLVESKFKEKGITLIESTNCSDLAKLLALKNDYKPMDNIFAKEI